MYLRLRDCKADERAQSLALAALGHTLATAGVTYSMALSIVEDRSAGHPTLTDVDVAACIERGIDAALALLPSRFRKRTRFQLVVTDSVPSSADKE